MKKITAGIISAGLCVALITVGTKTASKVMAEDSDNSTIETVTVSTESLEPQTGDVTTDGTEQLGAEANDIIKTLLASSDTQATGTYKEETVYVVADATGKSQKIIVSDWIKNADKDNKLNDKSDLTDIENVKGDETYTKNGSECVWDANGSDISYQGKTDKALPIEVKVTYELDGKVMSPEEIKGKSGHVVIRFNYENKTQEEVIVDGKKENMSVPFVMLSGIILDDDKFTNIVAPNCKLINDGSRTVAIGIAFPGLQDNLAIDREKFEIPESLEISADVEDFSLAMTVTVATNEIFGRFANLDVKDLDNLSDSMAELTNAMTQLTDGSEQLSDGLATLLEKSDALEEGVGKLADGSKALKDGLVSADEGAGKISDGAGTLADGAGQLSAGAGALDEGIGKLKDGAGQLKAGTDALSDGAGQLADGVTQLDTGAGALSDGAAQLKTGLDTLAGNNDALVGGAQQVFNSLLATAESQLKDAGAEIPQLTIENYGQVLEATAAKLNEAANAYAKADPQTAAVYQAKAKAVAELKASLDGYNTFYVGLKTYTDGVAQAATGAETLKNGVDTLKAGTGALKDGADALKNGADALKGGMAELDTGAEQLKSGADTLQAGADQLKGGLDQLKTGADSLKDGTGKLVSGADQLNGGLDELKGNIPALKDGVTQLHDGSVLLSDGIKEFNEKGIERITEAVEGELEGLVERVRVMSDLSKKYYNYSGISDDMNGQVKFIIRTEEIK